jgi:hypothetical protein
MKPTIIFCFGGRKANMELQLPLIRRILDENPNVSYDLWNMARLPADNRYLRTIEGDRITVINDFYDPNHGHAHFDKIYRHYTDPQYQGFQFVKIDDDVVFIETDRFSDFLDAIPLRGDVILSAKVVNNGACTPTELALLEGFTAIGIPLLDVHKHYVYADMSHSYFFDHWSNMIGQPVKLIPTEDWLSINLIGYTWETGFQFSPLLRTRSPHHIAGRYFQHHSFLGDEGVVNMFPRFIFQGMTACHLSFGPQLAEAGEKPFDRMRQRYAEIGQKYLAQELSHVD